MTGSKSARESVSYWGSFRLRLTCVPGLLVGVSFFLAGCSSVVARHPVNAASPLPAFDEARRQAIGLLKAARMETENFKVATMRSGFNFSVNERGIVLNYTRYQGLLDDKGVPVQTNCEFDYMDEPVVVEYTNKYWQWGVPLGGSCDRLELYFGGQEPAARFAEILAALKKSSAERSSAPGGAAGTGLSRDDLTAIVKSAVEGVAQAQKDAPKPASAIRSDVDQPAYKLVEGPEDFALVIGIGKYSDIPEAQFAERDAEAVRNHLLAMGYPGRNVIQLFGEKAGRSSMEKFLETWLPRNVKETSRVFFYFSGHGAPDTKTGEAYLIPWDGDPSFLENTGYPIKRLYEKLSALKAKEVIVAMDACFSGAGGRSVLAKGARPLVMKVQAAAVPQNLTVFAAASGEQITSTLDDQGHGTFTYYFLKGLSGGAKNAAGAVTAQGLYEYLKPKVQDAARRQNRDQEPALHSQVNRELLRFAE